MPKMKMAIVRSMLPGALQSKVDLLRPRSYLALKRELERLIDLDQDPMDIGALADAAPAAAADYGEEDHYGYDYYLNAVWKGKAKGKGTWGGYRNDKNTKGNLKGG